MIELTPMQAEALQAIRDLTRERGYPPTVRELCTALEVSSPSTVHAHLGQLARKGYISRDPRKPRAMVVTDPDPGEGR